MFTSLNEKIIELARSLTKKVFSGDVTLLRGLLVIIFYIPFWLVFQIYSIMFHALLELLYPQLLLAVGVTPPRSSLS